jgi:protein-S-isoprenylcysteine O-methyltransferase Ste14
MAAAQLNLGKSWRIGIDEGAAPGLVIGGLYRVSRNPIFLGMFASLAGLAILLPTAASVAMLVLAIGCVRAQVLEEEAYLLRTYGAEYRAFAGRVGRFVPGVGLLR